uniref:EamA domain-containing protein n=1 Tax=Percolomonas cosmopolitus TaxID=63605 RepID=A0A7S1KRC2_9EUKA|mmetsp:Transcript_6079/g.23022  ORF Transcript_6079/g.23022 Transcript_6079/m.23022 type:complete len:410 (+) Transcript_6079:264-1493(+)|eukprot:CAMPEP_0117438944 /NCGR_PEP_ID=MMETSP0759-20121206/2316_1 /TAXON_ID=63605 /ORGANISM="Percolomonas cosmopolitus, Strain WS" /LENGTH=409 /DNA_ID=CAMNT_0005230655 /DNA_START=211 /DNA_END=1440 /DNA_ORIENTATION=+
MEELSRQPANSSIQNTEHQPAEVSADAELTLEQQKHSERWTILSFAAFILLGAVWGSAFLFIKLAVEDENTAFPPMAMVMLRLTVGGWGMLLLLIFRLITSKKLRREVLPYLSNISTIFHLCFMGLTNNVIPFVFVGLAEGPLKTNVGVASILDSTIPLFAMPIAHFFIPTERLTFLKVVGLSIGFAGVILICLQSVNIGSGKLIDLNDLVGCIFVTIASASYGVASVYARKYLKTCPGLLAATGQILSGSFMMIVISLVWELGISRDHYGFWARASWQAWASIAYLGLASTLLAYILYFYLISTVGSGKQSMVGYLLPFFGVIEGVIFLGDWNGVPWYYCVLEVLGAFLIIGGIAIVNFDPKRYIVKGYLFLGMVSKKSSRQEDEEDWDAIETGGTRQQANENTKLLA